MTNDDATASAAEPFAMEQEAMQMKQVHGIDNWE
jgi:hypothetical protein